MPVKGLTDGPPAFVEIGRIRKGAPRVQGEFPKDLDYFRLDLYEGEEEAAKRFFEIYGAEPKELDVVLPFDRAEDNFVAWREAYLRGGLVHRCDGEFVHYEIDIETGERTVYNRQPEKRCDGTVPVGFYVSKGKRKPLYCEPRGRLKVILPLLRRMAFLTVVTGSKHDIVNLTAQLKAIEKLAGKVSGIPFVLRRRMKEISRPDPDTGRKVRTRKSLLSIEPDPRYVDAKLAAMEIEAIPQLDAPTRGFIEPSYRSLGGAAMYDEQDAIEEAEYFEDEDNGEREVEEPEGDGPFGKPVDPILEYFARVHKLGLTTQDGKDIAAECENDWELALKKLEEQHTPPDEGVAKDQ